MLPALPAPRLISGIYGVVVSSQNGKDKAQCMEARGVLNPRISHYVGIIDEETLKPK